MTCSLNFPYDDMRAGNQKPQVTGQGYILLCFDTNIIRSNMYMSILINSSLKTTYAQQGSTKCN